MGGDEGRSGPFGLLARRSDRLCGGHGFRWWFGVSVVLRSCGLLSA